MATNPESIDVRYSKIRDSLTTHAQAHTLEFWNELADTQKSQLLGDLECMDWQFLAPLIESHVARRPTVTLPVDLEPAVVIDGRDPDSHSEARERGTEMLRAGKVAAFTVAGGQGTRLGFDGPKGAFPFTAVANRTLFELFAMMVSAASTTYGVSIPWFLMTSRENDDATRKFFADNRYFGLDPEQVRFFAQGMLPALDRDGKLLLTEKHRIAMAPDGHGGSLRALADSGSLYEMEQRGVEVISYFQVDNPLVKPFDPLFIGLHNLQQSEMSTKVTPKAADNERVGNICLADGKILVVEYSEFPDELASAKNPDGSRRFDAGNLAIHMIDRQFVQRITGSSFSLPFRRADKVVPFVTPEGQKVVPEEPNGIKLESFVFDALPLAHQPLVLKIDRKEEFSPVKNASGVDSVETARRDFEERSRRWLSVAGLQVPDETGNSTIIEILPTFALDAIDVVRRRRDIPEISAGSRAELR
ncbi:MAG: UTP--glucose-1-phosphate uridylyltransferase [Planctomycetota bacterium]|jgi:UDP-N-acetylglucosamine/UDP-N-acetylgalactosamine diphosphorylase